MEELIESDSDAESKGSAVTLSWENLTVYTDCSERDFFVKKITKKIFGISVVNDEPNKILDSVTGHADGGSLVAIMGPSGAGKTTLLAALARRIKLSSGFIKINGYSVSRNTMSRIAGYLPQFDALPSSLTAMEYLLFTCALRLDKKTSPKERKILATRIFAQLGLLENSDTFISKLSGGETKRLSLAVELVTRPKILFLDEPTSGLDTWTAMRVIESAKAESRNGTLVFCSIHQPAMDLYKMFSHVILLANGRTAYYGTLENATKSFNSQGFHCPISFNEAEYYVKVLSNGDLVNSLNGRNSVLTSGSNSQSPLPHSRYSNALKGSDEINSQTSKPNQLVQFYWVTWRIMVKIRRTMFQDTIHHISFLLSAVLIGLFYYGVNSRTQSGVQDIKGALYIVSSEIIFTTAYSVVYVLPYEMPLYLRENSMYNPAAYYIATVIGLVIAQTYLHIVFVKLVIPKAVFHALTFLLIMYLALDINTNIVTLVKFAVCVIVSTIASSAYGTLTSSWIENSVIATTAMVPIDLISFTMAGIFYNIRSMSAYLSWLRYLSIFYYTNEALAIIHWTTVDSIECYPDENLPCLKNGREVLAEYGYDEFNLWIDACGLGVLTLIMHILGYLGVKRRRAVKSMY